MNPLPTHGITVSNVFPDETVRFPFDSLTEPVSPRPLGVFPNAVVSRAQAEFALESEDP
jgi:hypothetical protein